MRNSDGFLRHSVMVSGALFEVPRQRRSSASAGCSACPPHPSSRAPLKCLSGDLCVGLSGACGTSPFGRLLWPPTASSFTRPQCTVGLLAGTHWGALRCPSRMALGAERQPLWLCGAGGSGHVLWTSCIHAFFQHTSSTREVMLDAL